MKIHHIRNATFVIESGTDFILVDPMLSAMGALPPFSHFRHKAERNPTVPLPENAADVLDKVSLCLVTHSQKWGVELLTHTDHLDAAGINFLREKGVPVVCPARDAGFMEKAGIQVEAALGDWKRKPVGKGHITAVPGKHGHGWMHRFMANGSGFYLEIPGEPSIYISGDTVLTGDVERALTELMPDIAVVAAGGAGLDVGGQILMSLDEVKEFIRKAPGRVIANHMEALNHCPVSRPVLKQELTENGLLAKTFIPEDGESFTL